MEASLSRPTGVAGILLAFGRLLLFLHFVQSVSGGTPVESLTGYGDITKFQLETGYIGVDDDNVVQLFYYFFKSQNNPSEDPLLLWINGGPGCSGLAGIFFENGPITVDLDNYIPDTVPTLVDVESEHTWIKGLNIIYVDAPVGTGFSYATTPEGYAVSDTLFGEHVYEFLKKWLEENSDFSENPIYIAGEGYSGTPIPIVIQKILEGNAAGTGANINITGYVMGNPGTANIIDFNSRVPFVHRLAIIPDDMFKAADSSCNGQFIPPASNDACLMDMNAINELINQLNPVQILDPACNYLRKRQTNAIENFVPRRDLDEKFTDFLSLRAEWPPKQCTAYRQRVVDVWANNKDVQKELHVREGTVVSWSYCNDTLNSVFDHDISSVVDIHRNFTKTKLRGLIYSGDHDLSIPYIGTQQWIQNLSLTLEKPWQSWLVDREVAGYARKFTSSDFGLTFTTIKGAGHFAAEFRAVCSYMVEHWITDKLV